MSGDESRNDELREDELRAVAEAQPAFARFLGVELVSWSRDKVVAELVVREEHANRNGLLHGGAIMAFADNLGGTAASLNLPPGARLELNKALAEDKLHGIVLQDPVAMGYLGVKTMIDHLEGREVQKRLVTGEHVATRENMDDETMKKLLQPKQFQEGAAKPAEAKYRIAVVPKGTTHEFWKSVHAGAAQAATAALGVAVIGLALAYAGFGRRALAR